MKLAGHVIFYLIVLFWIPRVFAIETYTIDPAHSYVLWHVSHFGFSSPSGRWPVLGLVILDEKNPANSKVNVTVPLAEIVTGVKELDTHLLGPLFFDTTQFKEAIFSSQSVDVLSKNKARVKGLLTLHGVSRPITLTVILNKKGTSPLTQRPTVGFTAKSQLKRSDFNITTLLPGVSDEVNLEIEVEAQQ